MRAHLGEKPKGQRLEASLLAFAGQVERMPGVLERLGRMAGQQMDLSELTEARAAHVAHRLSARLERFLKQPERFLAASGLRICQPEEPRRRPAHAAPGPRQRHAALQQRDRSVQIALDDVEAPQGVGRDDAIELVTARLGDPDRLLSERDRFAELTEVAERQREPGARSDVDHGRAQPDSPPPEPCERLPDVAGFSFLLLPGVIPAARIVEAREPRTQRVNDPAEQLASLPKVAELVK